MNCKNYTLFGKGPLKVKTFDLREMNNVVGFRENSFCLRGHNGLSSAVTYYLKSGSKIERLNRSSILAWLHRLFIPKVGGRRTPFFLGR